MSAMRGSNPRPLLSIIFVNYYSQDSAFGYIGSNKMSEGQTGTEKA